MVAGGTHWFDRLVALPAVRWALRVPLLTKIVVGNVAVLLMAVVVAVAIAGPAAVPGRNELPLIVWTALVTGVTVAANLLLVRVALSPLRGLETTAHAVSDGDLAARAESSVLADATVAHLGAVFNEMLDSLESAQAVQRRLAVEVLEAEERERTRLAHELYEETAQTLATALLRTRLAAQSSGQRDEAFAALRTDIVSAMEGIKRIARTLRPPELDELGLSAAVAALVRALSERQRVPIECATDIVDATLCREARLALFRVLEDLLGQLVRRQVGHRLSVHVRERDDEVVTDVTEQLDPVTAASALGELDLDRLGQRAAYFGGTVQVRAVDVGHRVIRLTFPAAGRVATAAP